MFEIEDEFDVDDDFLDDVFGAENKENPMVVGQIGRGAEPATSQVCNPIDQRSGERRSGDTPEGRGSQSNFLATWRSHEDSDAGRCAGNRTIDLLQVKGDDIADSSCVLNTGGFTRNVRTRKFPGPAGLLPERQGNTSLIATEEFLLDLENEKKDLDLSVPEDGEVLSQESSRCFEVGCWGTMLRDLGGGLTSAVNVRAIRTKARQSRSLKLPAVALLLQSVDATTPDPCLTLRDASGEMYGTLHRDVWERYSDRLEPGAVMVLRSIGVISAGVASKRHYLNITPNNIATIYCANRNATGEEVLRIDVNPILRGDVPRLLDEWESLVVAPLPSLSVVVSPLPHHSSPRIFATVTGGDASRLVSRRGGTRSVALPNNHRQPLVPSSGMNRSFSPQTRPPSFRAAGIPPRPRGALDWRPPRPQGPSAPKRPRFEPSLAGTVSGTDAAPPPGNIFSVALDSRGSTSAKEGDVVEDLLDGIDVNSFFGDF